MHDVYIKDIRPLARCNLRGPIATSHNFSDVELRRNTQSLDLRTERACRSSRWAGQRWTRYRLVQRTHRRSGNRLRDVQAHGRAGRRPASQR